MVGSHLSIHGLVPHTRANGPGVRACLWLQGCTLACPGCFNPETHGRDGGSLHTVTVLVRSIRALGTTIDGVTISGGEPLQQWDGLQELLAALREPPALSVVLFTGFTLLEIQGMGREELLRATVDVLVAGRFVEGLRIAAGLRGSSNKVVHLFSDRYTRSEIDGTPPAEVLIDADGEIVITGMEPIQW